MVNCVDGTSSTTAVSIRDRSRSRIALARELLTHSALDMEAVTERAGFGSARHLRRIWRKYHDAAASSGRRAGAADA